MSEKVTESRRSVIAAAATGAATLAAASVAVGQPKPVRQARAINANAKAVMPDGKSLARGEVLAQLGLDPGTPPDAWLAIVACGSNASALKPGDLQSLVAKGTLKANQLDAAARAKLNR